MTAGAKRSLRRFLTRGTIGIGLLLLGQLICAAVFLFDILASLFGLRSSPIAWQLREMIELGAAFGLLAGLGLGAYAFRHAIGERDLAEERLRRAAGEFQTMLEERFAEWGLTPAERDVALFAIKGMSTAEIAALRETSEGTVKAQTNAIYRKAGVTGRPQLLSLFIEDLMRSQPAPEASPRARPGVTAASRAA
ncbi:helix-turn-helix transcriptional regulator [Gemmobacter caeruleus]|uniref:helix-turn-helix transcriptional regulator n=1 Tax=Gemmobacter caeruleus TaxID=2595004 RepID=UPI0011EF1775|nr:helix-turn-helix transcriptional regulator [Gemmobacter caeruleus]